MTKTTVLITGGAGYIGSHVSALLADNQYRLVVLDNLSTGHRWAVHPSAIFYEGKSGDEKLVSEILRKHKIESVMHFAASIEVPESISDPLKYYWNNTAQVVSLLESCIKTGVKHFIFSSTAAVYGSMQTRSLTEDSVTNPINPYGRSKLFTEQVLKDLGSANTGKFSHVILRYFNAAGARQDATLGQATPRTTHLIKTACEVLCGLRDKITVFGTDYPTDDGTGIRDYIHIDDLSSAHLLSLQFLENGGSSSLFNCGNAHGYSVKEVLSAIQKVTGLKLNIEYGPRREGDPAVVVADSTKIRKTLGWKPAFDDLETICKTAYEWELKLKGMKK